MGLRELLKRDVQHGRKEIADNKHAITVWDRQLQALSVPLPRKGIDYAYGTPDLGRLKAAGFNFICRYLGGDPDKDLTKDEAAHLSTAGFDIITVFESTANAALAGEGQGITDGKNAREQLEEIGGDARTAVVYFATDFEVSAGQIPVIRSYFRGVIRQLGAARVGIYGGYEAVHELMSLDNIRYGWQTYAWSGGRWSPHAQLRQIRNDLSGYGIGYDEDRALTADFGQFREAA
jgi:hypothetical protein